MINSEETVVLRQNVAQAVRSYDARTDRIILIRLLGKPMNITIIQAYAPTTEAEEEIESIYVSI